MEPAEITDQTIAGAIVKAWRGWFRFLPFLGRLTTVQGEANTLFENLYETQALCLDHQRKSQRPNSWQVSVENRVEISSTLVFLTDLTIYSLYNLHQENA